MPPLVRLCRAAGLAALLAAPLRASDGPSLPPFPEGYGPESGLHQLETEMPAEIAPVPTVPSAPSSESASPVRPPQQRETAPAPEPDALRPPDCDPYSDVGCESWCEPSCRETSRPACHCGPCRDVWTFRAGALAMRRSDPGRVPLVGDSFLPGGNTLIHADDMGFDYEPGWTIGLTRALGDHWDIGFRYFTVESWQASRDTLVAPAGAVVLFEHPLGNVNFPAEVGARLASEIDSVEANLTYHFGPSLRGIVGFRYMELGDGGLTIVQDVGPGLNVGRYEIEADNRLYGGQIGAEATLLERGRWTIDATAKLGVLGNHATNRASLTADVGPSFASAGEAGSTSFLGELELGGSYRLTKFVSVRATYSAMWLTGVAEAADQVPVSDPLLDDAAVDHDGSAFFHGAMIGIEYRR